MSTDPVYHSAPARLSAMLEPELPLTVWGPGELAAVLRHQLAAPLEFTPAAAEEPAHRATPLQPPGDGTAPSVELPQTFGALLLGPEPPLELLVRLKAYAKPFVTTAKAALPREIAAVLYYGAIVRARTRHGQRISELDDASLRYGLEGMLRCDWLDEGTRALIEEGLRAVALPPVPPQATRG